MNISDVGFFSSPCRGVHYGAGVISLCVCGQKLVYLAERTVIPPHLPHASKKCESQQDHRVARWPVGAGGVMSELWPN